MEKYIHIQVKDNGCGMDKETLRQIFDPFFTTKKGGEGTGLGLALAEQIITSHKGYIYAESKKGEGSTFHIYLPVLDTEHMPQIVQNIPRKDYRIVVADDNAKVLQLLKKNFEKIGIQIQTCNEKRRTAKMSGTAAGRCAGSRRDDGGLQWSGFLYVACRHDIRT